MKGGGGGKTRRAVTRVTTCHSFARYSTSSLLVAHSPYNGYSAVPLVLARTRLFGVAIESKLAVSRSRYDNPVCDGSTAQDTIPILNCGAPPIHLPPPRGVFSIQKIDSPRATTRGRRRRHLFHRLMPCHDALIFDIDYDTFVESAEAREARELATLHNDLAPVARLPPELLADIFVRCIPLSRRELHTDLSWLNITRVSSRWRSVALSCPDFWSTIVFSRPKWTPVMLSRSKMASLVIRIDLKKDHPDVLEPIILDNAHRLGTLDVRSPQDTLTTFIINLETADATPRLQTLRILNTDHDLGEGGMWLPRDLFRRAGMVQSRKVGVQPGLRLHLGSCAFPWDSHWYCHLTHLHLEDINTTQRPTMDAFLSILVGSPYLKSLTLIHCSPTTRNGFTVDLPHLSALTIKCNSSSTCARLLEYLSVPPSATVNASCTVKPDHDARHVLYQTLIPQFADLQPSAYDTVRIIHKNGFTISVLDSARPHWLRTLRIDAVSWTQTNVQRVTNVVLDQLDFSNVSTLHLQGMQDLSGAPVHGLAHMWDAMGRRLHRVRTLHLQRAFPAAWLEFLLAQAMLLLGVSHYRLPLGPAFRNEDGTLAHSWPGLQCIALHGVNLGEAADQLEPSPANMLRSLLWARREGGAPIWQLEIEDCKNVFTQDLGYFRLFADLVWDGKGHTTEVKEDGGDSLRAGSINVFANMIEKGQLSTVPMTL
ncbi:hypothetical protein B0H10DRAFT_1128017 [Mycena sp. CBHHK59/15]|nr:hypothetical protein B0H10DRAFT_1128017 [Mycena sp. CBHHK59/15]